MKDLKIFVSSTFVDLGEARKEIIKFLGVLQSSVINMEIFGSDESHSKDFSLEHVRKSNFFIGVYAARYGTVDEETGKSITELEYIEAKQMHEQGIIKGILLYTIDSHANWPLNLVQTEYSEKLKEFTKRIRKTHTVTSFRDVKDLPFFILRDLIRKIGIGEERIFKNRVKKIVKKSERFSSPVGMEYYKEETSPFFFGRENEITALEKQIIHHKMSLLIGVSGIGKTSILNAGLLPLLNRIGWTTAIVRPLNNPIKNLKKFLWDQLLQNNLPAEFDFSDIVKSIVEANEGKYVLVVIDQFEDVLIDKSGKEINEIINNLSNIFNSSYENFRMLISYRGDVESQVGNIWQKISGSVDGLPRFYLNALSSQNSNLTLKSTLQNLKILISDKDPNYFFQKITNDLEAESILNGFNGIYPPFVQMVITRIFNDFQKNKTYSYQDYLNSGSCRKIIADFLVNQLFYLGKEEENGKKVLISLVSSYGSKTQKTLNEIQTETDLNKSSLRNVINNLIDLRLIRIVNNLYEITHDLLAKTILTEIITEEEKVIKKFKNLLSSKTAAYETTFENLTLTEHLILYKYREKLSCTKDELKLLISSHIKGNGPIYYWLSKSNEIKLDVATCQGFIKKFVSPAAIYNDNKLIEAKTNYSKEEGIESLNKLIKTRSQKNQIEFENVSKLIFKHFTLKEVNKMFKDGSSWEYLFAIFYLGYKGVLKNIKSLESIINQEKIPQKYKSAAIKSIFRISNRFKDSSTIIKMLFSSNRLIIENSLDSIDKETNSLQISEILNFRKNENIYLTSSNFYSAIGRIATPKDLKILISFLKENDPRINEVGNTLLIICKVAGSNDFRILLDAIMKIEYPIDLSGSSEFYPSEIAIIIAKIASVKDIDFIVSLINTNDFWTHSDSLNFITKQFKIANIDNIYLVRWILGAAFGFLADRKYIEIVFKMFTHSYYNVRNAALNAITRIGELTDVNTLIDISISQPQNEEVVKAIYFLDEKTYLHTKTLNMIFTTYKSASGSQIN